MRNYSPRTTIGLRRFTTIMCALKREASRFTADNNSQRPNMLVKLYARKVVRWRDIKITWSVRRFFFVLCLFHAYTCGVRFPFARDEYRQNITTDGRKVDAVSIGTSPRGTGVAEFYYVQNIT